jgi:cobalt-zinc-cadmium efflux system outer membrane protein
MTLLVWALPALTGSWGSGSAGQPELEKITVERAVAEAIEKNFALMAQRQNIAVAEARIITARLRPNPVLTVEGDHLDLLGTRYSDVNRAGPAEFSARTDVVLERGGKRNYRIEAAEAAREVARLQFLDSVRSLVLDVQTAFADATLAGSNLALARENLKALNEIVEVNQARVRSGDLAEVELLRTRVAALGFQNAVRQGELRLRAALNRLKLLLGRSRDARGIEVAGDLRRDPGPVSRSDVERDALARRPDVLALRQDQARSAAELRLQLAQGKVDYVVGTEYRRQQGLAGTGNSLGLFFSAPLPLLNRNQGEIERARQEHQQIELRLRGLEATIRSDVDTAYEQYSTAKGLLETIERDMLQQSQDVRQIMEYSYRRGEATLVEFLDAQRAFNETTQAYNEARAEYARSLYLIDSIAGKSVAR